MDLKHKQKFDDIYKYLSSVNGVPAEVLELAREIPNLLWQNEQKGLGSEDTDLISINADLRCKNISLERMLVKLNKSQEKNTVNIQKEITEEIDSKITVLEKKSEHPFGYSLCYSELSEIFGAGIQNFQHLPDGYSFEVKDWNLPKREVWNCDIKIWVGYSEKDKVHVLYTKIMDDTERWIGLAPRYFQDFQRAWEGEDFEWHIVKKDKPEQDGHYFFHNITAKDIAEIECRIAKKFSYSSDIVEEFEIRPDGFWVHTVHKEVHKDDQLNQHRYVEILFYEPKQKFVLRVKDWHATRIYKGITPINKDMLEKAYNAPLHDWETLEVYT